MISCPNPAFRALTHLVVAAESALVKPCVQPSHDIAILKYSTQGSSSLMPAPPDLPESVLPSRDRNASTNPLRRINAENRKTDLEWANDFVEDCKAKKTKMNWKMCFDMGRAAGYFSTYANPLSLKNTFNGLKSKK
ncbi:hypothetical protein DM01DRAFT_1148563 [Hesseltinella vesiculosa]|uniref:Uncharacterized protein n=1 Tax=Hesseltinella vesiculosa TaxID=101127 RepID=A0A1X2G772_9FUNG|nr:hypothetical protein DM01DRAFT_1148563 [Hesseltinella vesiculosa]